MPLTILSLCQHLRHEFLISVQSLDLGNFYLINFGGIVASGTDSTAHSLKVTLNYSEKGGLLLMWINFPRGSRAGSLFLFLLFILIIYCKHSVATSVQFFSSTNLLIIFYQESSETSVEWSFIFTELILWPLCSRCNHLPSGPSLSTSSAFFENILFCIIALYLSNCTSRCSYFILTALFYPLPCTSFSSPLFFIPI